jgi:ferrochelatase
MKPDFADLMPEIAATGGRAVLAVPVQFLADHLETLYDVDLGAREQAVRARLRFLRARSLNTYPGLIDALASVARRTLGHASIQSSRRADEPRGAGSVRHATVRPT